MVKRNALHAIYLLTLAIVIAAICIALLLPDHGNTQEPQRPPRDYPEIKQDGTLNAVTEYNALGYYADKDTIAGFQYELIQAFAARIPSRRNNHRKIARFQLFCLFDK